MQPAPYRCVCVCVCCILPTFLATPLLSACSACSVLPLRGFAVNDVIGCCAQVRDMRQQLSAIEEKVGRPEGPTTLTNLRAEYEKQITNIRDLKQLYEERARVLQLEKDKQAGELEQRVHEVP